MKNPRYIPKININRKLFSSAIELLINIRPRTIFGYLKP